MSLNQQLNVVQVLDDDSMNWPLWQSKMCLIFEYNGLLSHIEGTAEKPTVNATLMALTQPSKEQMEMIDKYEERLSCHNS
jgi:hypothetical protein